jgi:phosphatidylinositol kinase/protein kinase (PI-3  family)
MMIYFKTLLLRGLLELKKHYDSIIKLVEIMSISTEINCFKQGNQILILEKLKERFLINKNEMDLQIIIGKWIEQSYNNWRTNYYDKFQLITNGIKP